MVSEAKCSIFSGPNVNVDVKAQVCTELNIMTKTLSDTYLGLPSMVGLEMSNIYVYLLERIIQHIKGWKEKVISMGANEIQLKYGIQSIPVYAMSVFKIPKSLYNEMNDDMTGFWWGDLEDQKNH